MSRCDDSRGVGMGRDNDLKGASTSGVHTEDAREDAEEAAKYEVTQTQAFKKIKTVGKHINRHYIASMMFYFQ